MAKMILHRLSVYCDESKFEVKMLYFQVKIRETKNLVPSEVGLTLYPEKHGNLIKVDVSNSALSLS